MLNKLRRLLSIFRAKQVWELYCGSDGSLLAIVTGRKGAVPQVKDYQLVTGKFEPVGDQMTIRCTSKKHGKGMAHLDWKQIS